MKLFTRTGLLVLITIVFITGIGTAYAGIVLPTITLGGNVEVLGDFNCANCIDSNDLSLPLTQVKRINFNNDDSAQPIILECSSTQPFILHIAASTIFDSEAILAGVPPSEFVRYVLSTSDSTYFEIGGSSDETILVRTANDQSDVQGFITIETSPNAFADCIPPAI